MTWRIFFYCDPPWGDTHIKYFNTLLQKHTGEEAELHSYTDFLIRMFKIATMHTKNIIMVEYGLRWNDEVIRLGRDSGLLYIGGAECLYRSGAKMLPQAFNLFSKVPIITPDDYFQRLYHKTGLEFMTLAATPFYVPNGIILDPCCGLGLSARLALRLNMRFRGNEINRVRAEKTISLLS